MSLQILMNSIDAWDIADCIAFLEQDDDVAPEYDVETNGLTLLREDCREKARSIYQAA
jgi:hypothetical protein